MAIRQIPNNLSIHLLINHGLGSLCPVLMLYLLRVILSWYAAILPRSLRSQLSQFKYSIWTFLSLEDENVLLFRRDERLYILT